MQFGIGDSILLMKKTHNGTTFGVGKCFITTHGVVSSVLGDIFMGLLLEMVCTRWSCMV